MRIPRRRSERLSLSVGVFPHPTGGECFRNVRRNVLSIRVALSFYKREVTGNQVYKAECKRNQIPSPSVRGAIHLGHVTPYLFGRPSQCCSVGVRKGYCVHLRNNIRQACGMRCLLRVVWIRSCMALPGRIRQPFCFLFSKYRKP